MKTLFTAGWWWTNRQRPHEGRKNTFAVTLAANQNEKQNKAKYYEQT
jgi:hypothetical protein